MIICTNIVSLQKAITKYVKEHKNIGFVPTMGALHDGHLSLIKQSNYQQNITICSIFVNPTQFNDPTDFEKYPKTIEQDLQLLEATNCAIVFLPTVTEIYPKGLQNHKQYDLGFLELSLEGSTRPGHFQGVCLVVERLLEIVQPNFLYLGQKDYQQCMVITKLVKLMQLENKINIQIGATVRETNGLAMSSRNLRLNESQKKDAAQIFQLLTFIKKNIETISINELIAFTEKKLIENNFDKIDYITICNATNLQPITSFDANTKTIALIAAFIGGVRLIDNLLLN